MPSSKAITRRASYYAFAARAAAARSLGQLSRRTTKDRLIVFDPALLGYSGHHLEFARLLKIGLASSFDVKFYANFRAATRIIAELPAQPICYNSVYPGSGDFQTINADARTSLVASLRKVDMHELTPRTIFLMHTLTVYQLTGLAEWFVSLPPAHRPKLFLQFQFPLEYGVHSDSEWPSALAIARQAAHVLASAGQVFFTTNSDLLKDRISLQLGHRCQLMPMPIRWPNLAQQACSPQGAVFGFYGGLRIEKGSRLIAEAIPPFAQRYSDTRFIIHAPRAECDEDAVARLSNLRKVELIRTNFKDKEEYFAQFCRARCVLLPYDPLIYAYRTSGIFVEAIGLGRTVITTNGSWMAHELRKRSSAGITMPSFTARALYDCLEIARDAALSGSGNCDIDREIMSSNSPSAFCAALITLVRG